MPLLLLLLAACASPEAEGTDASGSDTPWVDLETIPVDPWRLVLRVPMTHGRGMSRLHVAGAHPSVLALDEAGAVHLFDGRFRHTDARWCVSLYDWEHLEDGRDRTGDCADGAVELQPGEWIPGQPVTAVAPDVDGAGAWAVDARGGLWHAELGWSVDTNPLDHGRLDPVAETGLTGVARAAATPDGGIWVATSDTRVLLDASGIERQRVALAEPPDDLLVSGEHLWAAGPSGVWRDDVRVSDAPTARLAPDGAGGVWASSPANSAVTRIGADGARIVEASISGVRGPLAVDPRNGWVRVLTDMGVTTVAADGSMRAEDALDEPALDIAITPAGEIVLMEGARMLAIVVDETALPQGPPLHVAISAFFENPRDEGTGLPCSGQDESLETYVATAEANAEWLARTPAAVALGITPTALRRAAVCGQAGRLAALADASRTEPGVLFHDSPRCADAEDCVNVELSMDLLPFQAQRVFPTWASGLTSWEADWAQALIEVGGPRTIWFFGLSADPSIPHDDPRAKEALPWRGDAPPSTWSIDSAEQIAVRAPAAGQPAPTRDGALDVWPGLTASGFNLGACDNVSMAVCRRVAAGGGDTFDAADVAVLDVLLLRALALRDPTTASSWSFHLPAIELYDYTEGCEVDGWRWTGDRCEAARLQDWAIDAELRHVRAGHMAWTLPSALP